MFVVDYKSGGSCAMPFVRHLPDAGQQLELLSQGVHSVEFDSYIQVKTHRKICSLPWLPH